MKNLKLYLVLMTVGVIAIIAQGQGVNAAQKGPYHFKTAYAEMETTGPNIKSSEKVYISDFGKVEGREREDEINAVFFKQTEKNYTLRDHEILYSVDLKTEKGTRMNLEELQDGMLGKKFATQLRRYDRKAIEEFGGVFKGTEMYLNKKCDRIEFPEYNMFVLVYKGFPLYSETRQMNMVVVTKATKFEENAKIPKEKITLSKNYTITDAPKMDEIFKQMNGYKDSPEYQEYLEERKNVRESASDNMDGYEEYGDYNNSSDEMPEGMPDLQKALEESGPGLQDAMKALGGFFN